MVPKSRFGRVAMLTVVLALAVGAGAAVAEGGVIDACINPSGSVFVVEAPADCGENETPISWSVAGSGGAATSFYTVETVVQSPPIPDAGEAVNWIPAGTEFACDAGDVAVDFSVWSVMEEYFWNEGEEPGEPTVAYGAVAEDPITPLVSQSGAAPTGFVALREVPVGSHHFVGMMGEHFAATSTRHFMVTCADVS